VSPPPSAAPQDPAAAFVRRGAGAWVVDAFAGADLQRAALRGVSADGAALAGAAGDGARIVLAEEDPGLLLRIEADLARAGRAARRTDDPASCAPGEVVLVEASFAVLLDRLLPATDGAPLLLRLAPLAARALPWAVLERAAAHPGAELLLRLPAEDFARQGRFAGPVADLPPHLRRTVEACSALLDDPRHGWIAAWREAEHRDGTEAALLAMAGRLAARLEAALPGHAIRVAVVDGIPLLRSTADGDAAAEVDRALPGAEDAPTDAPPGGEEPGEEEAGDGALDLFPLPRPAVPDPAPSPARVRRPPRAAPPPPPPDLFDPPDP
jgi:hypothetical protein